MTRGLTPRATVLCYMRTRETDLLDTNLPRPHRSTNAKDSNSRRTYSRRARSSFSRSALGAASLGRLTLANTGDTPTNAEALNGTGTDRLGFMSAAIHRRERGTGAGNVVLKVDVAAPAKALVERVATHMGLSKGQATEMLLMSIRLDSRGLPLWDNIDDFQNQGALPIAKAG
jgi:hypothetical protein